MNGETIKDVYKTLEKCTEHLESEVKTSLNEIETNHNCNEKLENSKDYHTKEILSHLKKIKDHIEIITHHAQELELLKTNKRQSRIDKDYIKKQVEAFDNEVVVHKRENKPKRPPETSSATYLAVWENFLQHQQLQNKIPENFAQFVKKRQDNTRKKKKVISSTAERFLDRADSLTSMESFDEEDENLEAINLEVIKDRENEEDRQADTKPRIVEVIYKKNVEVPSHEKRKEIHNE